MAYAEDRKTKAELDEREVIIREARAANPPAEAPEPKRVRKSRMPSAGMTLAGQEVVVSGAHPAVDASGVSTRHGHTTQDDDGEYDDEMEEDSGSDRGS